MGDLEKIGEEYLLPADMAIVEKWASKKNCSISFRAAGRDTLKCLLRGAGAKPHQILDKTIKYKENEETDPRAKENNNQVRAFFEGFKKPGEAAAEEKRAEEEKVAAMKDLLTGMVGHRNDKEKIDGIFLTSLGAASFDETKIARTKNGMPYLKLEDWDQKNALMLFYKGLGGNKEYQFSRLFFSGDYDIHDLLQVHHPVPTKLDQGLLEELQRMLLVGRKEQLPAGINENTAGMRAEDYRRVQHGPQSNYTAQMFLENLEVSRYEDINAIADSVACMSPPVAVYEKKADKGQWSVLKTDADITEYYRRNGLTVKSTWRDPAERDKYIKNAMERAVCFYVKNNGAAVFSASGLYNEFLPFKEVFKKDNFVRYMSAVLEEMAAKQILVKTKDNYKKK